MGYIKGRVSQDSSVDRVPIFHPEEPGSNPGENLLIFWASKQFFDVYVLKHLRFETRPF